MSGQPGVHDVHTSPYNTLYQRYRCILLGGIDKKGDRTRKKEGRSCYKKVPSYIFKHVCMPDTHKKSLGTLIALLSTKKLQENVQDSALVVAVQEQRWLLENKVMSR